MRTVGRTCAPRAAIGSGSTLTTAMGDGPRIVWEAGAGRYAVIDQAHDWDQRAAMTEYSAIYEQTREGWWVYFPDLPGCTTFGRTRDEAERNAREAVAAHVPSCATPGGPCPSRRAPRSEPAAATR